MSENKIRTSDVIWREDLYPRFEPNPQTIQRYAEDVTVLPPIEINQHNELIDGYHRWKAHVKANEEYIKVTITETKNESQFLAFACERNSKHGLQLSQKDKKAMAIRLYASGTGLSKDEISNVLSVSLRTVSNYTSDIDKQLREERKARIEQLWLSCYTQDEIADAVGVSIGTVNSEIESCSNLENFPKLNKLQSQHLDADFAPPLYDVWTFGNKTNDVSHFGNTEVRIVDNLLYLYTQPFDIVIDPFAGGGSTIDICKKRLRRYWASDRLPVVERNDIRQADILDGIPQLNNRWGEVSLLYLDPPYWKQAEGQYSDDDNDLANMTIENFYNCLISFINECSSKMKSGSHIARNTTILLVLPIHHQPLPIHLAGRFSGTLLYDTHNSTLAFHSYL